MKYHAGCFNTTGFQTGYEEDPQSHLAEVRGKSRGASIHGCGGVLQDNHRSVAFAKLLEMVSRGYTLAKAADSQMPVDILVEQQELIHINDAAGFWQTQKCLKCPVCSHDDAFLTREYNRNINVALQNALDAWSGASKSLML